MRLQISMIYIYIYTTYLLWAINSNQLLVSKRYFLQNFQWFQYALPALFYLWKPYAPSFLSSEVIFTLVSVISLNEARKRTTSPFSFFIGTISNRHQNGAPAKVIKIQVSLLIQLCKSNWKPKYSPSPFHLLNCPLQNVSFQIMKINPICLALGLQTVFQKIREI